MPRIRYESEVNITETKDGFFIASLIINGVINHSTYPQRSQKNAILLINRQIERFNAMNEVRLPLYGQKQRKPKGTSDKMKKAGRTRMMKSWVKSLELFKDYTKQRLNQPEDERQVYFSSADLHRQFKFYLYTKQSVVHSGLLAPPKDIVWQGRRALISTFDELTEYFGKIEVLINEHNSGLGTPRIQ
ncbi:hypothetical protein [Haemophilus parainfluenzae]|uniref:Uncharacterized protein n=1 Tax=Haemophilus parainfluenzae TaxID=729 RepID=A0A7M1NX23_HAEPA|nr:hypothetical protein [Haemophilus parainfluenzae]QOR16844.1 hypothetical protein INP94_08180 [Haemophilus parainfluenzae]